MYIDGGLYMSDQLISQALRFQLDEDPAVPIRLRINEYLNDIRIGGADVLVGVWEPSRENKTAGGIILTDKSRDEYAFQGVTGLILKIGPHAFNTQKTQRWFLNDEGEADPPRVGEWVSFNFKQGEAFKLGKQMCRLVQDEYILMRLTRPDLVA